jgi:2-(1,2-epoxy-1,2-dihydrophenyl)acetyl-CoA isomerase
MNDLVLREINGPVAILTLNRAQRHNSLVPVFLEELLDEITAVAHTPTIRALIIQANGRSFSTGGDALGFVEHEHMIQEYALDVVGLLNQVILALLDLPAPVITAVHGIVTGGSIGLALAADVVLVTPQASFTPYYSVVGPSPDGGWTALLPDVIGRQRAAEVLFTNATIDAATAVTWGLANRLVPADQLRETAFAIALDIAAKKQGSVRRTKHLLNWDRDDIARRLEAERQQFVQEVVHGEAMPGFQAFVDELRRKRNVLS